VDWRGAKKVLWALLVLVLALCLPATAAAEGEEDTGAFGAFRLKASNGYRVLVLASSRPHFAHGEAVVWVTGRNAAVLYLAPATVTATSIDADLGALGTISVDFEPVGRPEPIRPDCDADGSAEVQPGFWVGTVELDGEEGFTHAETTRVKSTVSPFIDLVCGESIGIGETSGPGSPGARLVARSATKKQARFLQVNQNRPGGPVNVEASLEERRQGGLIVSREIERRYSGNAFGFDPELQAAVLDPPSPFSGHATFRRHAKPSNRWTGNLTLDFPGRADVSMAGGRFNASLSHAERTEDPR
jgi:hypothetical protein